MPTRSLLEPESDDRLVARTAAGDAQAFALLFQRRQAEVYRFALHMTGTAAAADDVTQDVFMAVMSSAGRYEPGRSGVAAWLCGIARNCARQRLARDRSFQPLDDDHEPSGDKVGRQPDPLGDLTRAEGIEQVRRAVLRLPVKYREVVVLCDLQELSYAEAADALACAVGTLRSRLHRGRHLLAGKLLAGAAATQTSTELSTDRLRPSDRAAERPDLPATLETTPLRSAKLRGTRSCA